MSLEQAARDLAQAVSGIDYDGAQVHKCRVALHGLMVSATAPELAAALRILTDRIASARVDDADGAAFAALSAGALVENGAPAEPLARILLAKVPEFLTAARRFADLCIADLPAQEEEEENPPPEDQILTEVDGRRITHYVFRAHAPADRGGASALALLQPWTLPTVAGLSRHRPSLLQAAATDSSLRKAVGPLAQSHAQWLAILLGAQLDATWLVVCPREKRGFRMLVDGVVSNFDLQALVADAIIDRGLPGVRNAAEVIASIKGVDVADSPRGGEVASSVTGQFQFYEWQAAAHAWNNDDSDGHNHPMGENYVWGEGIPSEVPRFKDVHTLIVGPQTIQRSWNNARMFSALRCDVTVKEELGKDEVVSLLAEMKAATSVA